MLSLRPRRAAQVHSQFSSLSKIILPILDFINLEYDGIKSQICSKSMWGTKSSEGSIAANALLGASLIAEV